MALTTRARRWLPIPREPTELALDRTTASLAVVSVGLVAGVAVTEVLRLMRRRAKDQDTEFGALNTALAASGDAVQVARSGYDQTPTHEAALLHMLTGMVAAFAAARVHTYGARQDWWYSGIVLGRRHIHHFVPGILLAFGSGAAALVTKDEDLEPILAWPFGVGVGLTLDETAMLLQLEDVYWSREGILSVQVSLAAAAALGAAVLSGRLIRRGESRAREEGLLPPTR